MRHMTDVLSCISVVVGAMLFAGCPVVAADLQIASSREEILVTPVRNQTFSLVVTNNGPEGVDNVAVTGRSIDLTRLTLEIADPGRCIGGVVEVTGNTAAFRWQIGALAATASTKCTLSFRAVTGAPTSSLLYLAEVAAPGNVDGNPFNSAARTTIYYSSIDAPVDARITARIDPGGILCQDAPQRLRVTVTNVGTTVVPGVTVLSIGYTQAPIDGAFRGYDLFEVVETAPCFLTVDAEPPFVFFVAFGFDDALAPGASRTCTIGIRALPGAAGVAELPLDLFPRGPGVYDVAPQDNTAIVRVDFGNIGVPRAVTLSPIGWLVLMGLIAIVAVAAMRRSSHRELR